MVMLNQGGDYLKVEHVQDGDVIQFVDEGTWVESKFTYPDGNPKQEFVIRAAYKGNEYNVRVGKFSRDELIPVYGTDTSKWIGRKARVKIETYRSLNKKGLILSPVDEVKEDQAWDDK